LVEGETIELWVVLRGGLHASQGLSCRLSRISSECAKNILRRFLCQRWKNTMCCNILLFM